MTKTKTQTTRTKKPPVKSEGPIKSEEERFEIHPIIKDFQVPVKVKEGLSKKILERNFQDPKRTCQLLRENLFATMRDLYLEVDPKGDPTAFVTHYQKESLK